MFQLRRPTAAQLNAFLSAQQHTDYSYAARGATRTGPTPTGYTVDHNRVPLGTGAEVFDQARAALVNWRMSTLGWSFVHGASARPTPGETVAIVLCHYGFWSVNAARVVYVLDEDVDGVRRAGFAYGTLPAHAERGEERFSVEWHAADDSVWYDLYAFSRPAHVLARLANPLARRLQRRFARESMQAMLDATVAARRVAQTE